MKPIGPFALHILVSLAMAGCSKSGSSVGPNLSGNRLSADDAAAIVRQEIFRETSTINSSAVFPVEELTTPEIWNRLHVQIFRVTSGMREDDAYLVHDRRASPLGSGFGGAGIMSMCVADLNRDGHPQLLFSYSWGSGIHRSLVAAWIGGDSWVNAKPVLRDYDLYLDKTDDQHVDVWYGDFRSAGTFNRRGHFGKLHGSANDPTTGPAILVDTDLPAEIGRHVWQATTSQ